MSIAVADLLVRCHIRTLIYAITVSLLLLSH